MQIYDCINLPRTAFPISHTKLFASYSDIVLDYKTLFTAIRDNLLVLGLEVPTMPFNFRQDCRSSDCEFELVIEPILR